VLCAFFPPHFPIFCLSISIWVLTISISFLPKKESFLVFWAEKRKFPIKILQFDNFNFVFDNFNFVFDFFKLKHCSVFSKKLKDFEKTEEFRRKKRHNYFV